MIYESTRFELTFRVEHDDGPDVVFPNELPKVADGARQGRLSGDVTRNVTRNVTERITTRVTALKLGVTGLR